MSDYKLYLTFTKQAEGGLSKAKTDTASSYPVPDGSGYHTNKGITWKTFETYGKILGYKPTPALFYKMPENIWLGIFKSYWDGVGANLVNSQAMANIIFQSVWGGGSSNLIKDIQRYLVNKKYPGVSETGKLGTYTANAINKECANVLNEIALYNYTHAERLKYLRSLSSYAANKGGWEDRMKKLYDFATELINAAVKKKAPNSPSAYAAWFWVINNFNKYK